MDVFTLFLSFIISTHRLWMDRLNFKHLRTSLRNFGLIKRDVVIMNFVTICIPFTISFHVLSPSSRFLTKCDVLSVHLSATPLQNNRFFARVHYPHAIVSVASIEKVHLPEQHGALTESTRPTVHTNSSQIFTFNLKILTRDFLTDCWVSSR